MLEYWAKTTNQKGLGSHNACLMAKALEQIPSLRTHMDIPLVWAVSGRPSFPTCCRWSREGQICQASTPQSAQPRDWQCQVSMEVAKAGPEKLAALSTEGRRATACSVKYGDTDN